MSDKRYLDNRIVIPVCESTLTLDEESFQDAFKWFTYNNQRIICRLTNRLAKDCSKMIRALRTPETVDISLSEAEYQLIESSIKLIHALTDFGMTEYIDPIIDYKRDRFIKRHKLDKDRDKLNTYIDSGDEIGSLIQLEEECIELNEVCCSAIYYNYAMSSQEQLHDILGHVMEETADVIICAGDMIKYYKDKGVIG